MPSLNILDQPLPGSRDVGSYTAQGQRVLIPQFKQFECKTLDETLKKQTGKRIEAWINASNAAPIALLLIDPNKRKAIIQLAKKHNLPVVYNPYL